MVGQLSGADLASVSTIWCVHTYTGLLQCSSISYIYFIHSSSLSLYNKVDYFYVKLSLPLAYHVGFSMKGNGEDGGANGNDGGDKDGGKDGNHTMVAQG